MMRILYALYCDCCGTLIRKETFNVAHNHFAPLPNADPHPMWDLCITCKPDLNAILERRINELRAKRKPKSA